MLPWPSEAHRCALMPWSRCLAQCRCFVLTDALNGLGKTGQVKNYS